MTENTTGSTPQRIVGVGASAGGLASLERLFSKAPANSGTAWVVVQHLSPDYRSLMVELLARHTRMDVCRVVDGIVIAPDTVYVIPPGEEIETREGRLYLHARAERSTGTVSYPIDRFLDSLAADVGSRAIAVILSGTGSDGSRGVRSIAEAGGVVLAESPSSAQFDGMPRSALDTGVVDVSGDPAELADMLNRLLTADEPIEPVSERLPIYDGILAAISQDGAVDFSVYKRGTLHRRIERRAQLSAARNLDGYFGLIREDANERQALREDLLIGVTRFFRDTAAWETLDSGPLEEMIRTHEAGNELRAWVAACSTGEEAYTLAIVLREAMERVGRNLDVKIFATDVNEPYLEFAAQGVYARGIANDLTPERLRRWFHAESHGYRVHRSLREMIIFAPHDLTRHTPFTRLHLVTCRNVLIYLQPEAQSHVLEMLHYALEPGGVLMLGAAEGLNELGNGFETLQTRWKQYRKRAIARPGATSRTLRQSHIPRRPTPAMRRQRATGPVAEQAANLVLESEDATCILLGPDLDVLHVLGRTPDWLRHRPGRFTSDVAELVPRTLALSITTAARRARRDATAVDLYGIHTSEEDRSWLLDVRVAHHPATEARMESVTVVVRPSIAGTRDEPSTFDVDDAAQRRIRDLEVELLQARESLQATIEELETTNEEQQATNEELIASNEELQSTNEELQSVNEELYTVNAEYQAKILELVQLNADVDNLLQSIDVGVVFVDRSLLIRRFTDTARESISLHESDVGRPLGDLTHRLTGLDLPAVLQRVLDEARPIGRTVTDPAGETLLVRAHPYRTDSHGVDGAVLTIVNVSALQRRHQLTLETGPGEPTHLAVAILDPLKRRVRHVSPGWGDLVDRAPTSLVGPIEGLDTPVEAQDRDAVRAARATAMAGDEVAHVYRVRTSGGRVRWMRERLVPLRSSDGSVLQVIAALDDVTAAHDATTTRRDRQLERLVESTADALFVIDREGRVRWSDGAATLFERDLDALSAGDLVHPADRDAVEKARQSVTRRRPTVRHRWRAKLADGGITAVDETWTGAFDSDGAVAGGSGMLRRAAPTHTSDDGLDRIARTGVTRWTWDASSDAVVLATPHALGLGTDGLTSMADLVATAPEVGRETIEATIARARREGALDLIAPLRRADGTTIDILWRGAVVDDDAWLGIAISLGEHDPRSAHRGGDGH